MYKHVYMAISAERDCASNYESEYGEQLYTCVCVCVCVNEFRHTKHLCEHLSLIHTKTKHTSTQDVRATYLHTYIQIRHIHTNRCLQNHAFFQPYSRHIDVTFRHI
jgi:hypothetical protein